MVVKTIVCKVVEQVVVGDVLTIVRFHVVNHVVDIALEDARMVVAISVG